MRTAVPALIKLINTHMTAGPACHVASSSSSGSAIGRGAAAGMAAGSSQSSTSSSSLTPYDNIPHDALCVLGDLSAATVTADDSTVAIALSRSHAAAFPKTQRSSCNGSGSGDGGGATTMGLCCTLCWPWQQWRL